MLGRQLWPVLLLCTLVDCQPAAVRRSFSEVRAVLDGLIRPGLEALPEFEARQRTVSGWAAEVDKGLQPTDPQTLRPYPDHLWAVILYMPQFVAEVLREHAVDGWIKRADCDVDEPHESCASEGSALTFSYSLDPPENPNGPRRLNRQGTTVRGALLYLPTAISNQQRLGAQSFEDATLAAIKKCRPGRAATSKQIGPEVLNHAQAKCIAEHMVDNPKVPANSPKAVFVAVPMVSFSALGGGVIIQDVTKRLAPVFNPLYIFVLP